MEKIIIEACEKATQDNNDSSSSCMAEEQTASFTPPDTRGPNPCREKGVGDAIASFSLDEEDASLRPPRRSRYSITSPMDYGTHPSGQSASASSLHRMQVNALSSRLRSFSDAISIHGSNPMPGNHTPLGLLNTSTQETEDDPDADPSSKPLSRNPSAADDHSRFPEFVVLDCSFVTGFDANASVGLFKLRNKLANQELGSSVPLPIYLFFAGTR